MIAGAVLAAVVWTAPVSLPAGSEGWAAAPVPGWLEVVEGGDLDRVRLLDGAGHEVPYRLVDPAATEKARWRDVTPVNLVHTPLGFACDVPAGELVDAVQLVLTGETGVAEVTVSTADGGELVGGVRVGRLRDLAVTVVPLPLTDAARLHVVATTLLPGLTLDGVRLRRALAPRDAPRTTWVRLDVQAVAGADDAWWLVPAGGGPERISRLSLEVAAPPVLRRRAKVLASSAMGGPSWRVVGSAWLERIPLGDGQPGIESLDIGVRPGAYPRLRLEAPAGAEAPLALAGARAEVAPRWLAFPRGGAVRPLHLEAGSRGRSRSLDPAPLPIDMAAAVRADIGVRQMLPPQEAATSWPRPSWTDLLFIAAALLLLLLGWRVFAARQ